jgi:adenylylsulfate kinase-like enzyme/phosphohistidine swiveling domain-containing protein
MPGDEGIRTSPAAANLCALTAREHPNRPGAEPLQNAFELAYCGIVSVLLRWHGLDAVLLMLVSNNSLAIRARQFTEPPARVFWITGLSGAGKSTIGERLSDRLRAAGHSTVFLDGDKLRAAIADDLGHPADDRRRSALRNGRLCQLLADQGISVICATISLFHEVQRWNRAHIPGYCEIFLRVPLSEVERRDPKGIYARAREGKAANVVGIDIAAEEPETPDLIIENYGDLDADTAVQLIWRRFIDDEPTLSREIAAVPFGTKAETLENLESPLRRARVLPQIRFSVAQWRADPQAVLKLLGATNWGQETLIVRSSAKNEDGASLSGAGKYQSVIDVRGNEALAAAVERVISSFDDGDVDNQVFVQPMLSHVSMAGVAFTRDPNGGAPYFVINYDTKSGRTDLVTSGVSSELKTFYCLKSHRGAAPLPLVPVVEMLTELEEVLASDALDVEFAADQDGELYLLQVRPLILNANAGFLEAAELENGADQIACKIDLLNRPHPYLSGKRSIFGVMPDWNPAEIIGIRPKPLTLTLYRELITDSIWAYQRDNYGYKNLRSFPLMVSFHGLPYIDVRVSFNSFVPSDVDGALADRLVNYYIDRLLGEPNLHDKVEFEIIFSCHTFDLADRIAVLERHGFSKDETALLSESLRRLTNRIIHSEDGLWRRDREKIDVLAERLTKIRGAGIDKISRIYWLIEDCKRYGTLPFAGLARAGFIAMQLLRSLVTTGVLNESEYAAFLANLETVGSGIGRDFAKLSKSEFLERYGHLRPGTYDILSPRYDETPDHYFDWAASRVARAEPPRFALSVAQLRQIEKLLREHQLDHDVLGLIDFIRAGIEGREFAKFVFTRSLSDTLVLIRELGEDHGIGVEDCAFLELDAILGLYHQSGDVEQRLRENISENKRHYALTQKLILPPLISATDDVYSFHLPSTQPNYITQNGITASIAHISDSPANLAGKILFIPSADPGFDWIFTRGIAGFVTKFGGVNSHMAIRANELNIPAVIGAGEVLFQRWGAAKKIHLDCGNRRVQFLQ